jgi:hypothetical protein
MSETDKDETSLRTLQNEEKKVLPRLLQLLSAAIWR